MAEEKKTTPEVEKKTKVTLNTAFNAGWKKYAEFKGRLSRKGYWLFTIGNIITYILIIALVAVLVEFGVNIPKDIQLEEWFWLVALLPTLAACARRLHDTNKSGWLLLVALIPVIGQIILLVFFLQKGDQAENDYGPVPEE